MSRLAVVKAVALGVIAAVALTVAGVSLAAGSQLTVAAGHGVASDSLSRCAAAMASGSPVITTNGATGAVNVSGVPTACAGLGLSVNLHDASGAVLASGTTGSATTTQSVPVGTYAAANVVAAVVKLDGWVFPTAWTSGTSQPLVGCVGLDAAGNVTADPCTLTIGTVVSWPSGSYQYAQFKFTAVTAAPLWRVTFDFSDATTFPGFTPVAVVNNQNVATAPGYQCSQLPVFVGVEANPSWNSVNGDLIITTDPGVGGNRICP